MLLGAQILHTNFCGFRSDIHRGMFDQMRKDSIAPVDALVYITS